MAAAVMSLAITCGVLHWILPPCELGGKAFVNKLAYFAPRRDDYEVLVFGSSRVLNGVIPAELDARLAASGRPWKSFNFGVGGMTPPEVDVALRKVLALRPKRLRHVIVEISDNLQPPPPANRFTGRVIAYHDARTTASLITGFNEGLVDAAAARREAWFAALHLIARSMNCGRALEYIAPIASAPRFIERKFAAMRGYSGSTRTLLDASAATLAEAAKYRAFLTQLERGPLVPTPGWQQQQMRFLEQQTQALESCQVEVHYFIPPGVAPQPSYGHLDRLPRYRPWNYRDQARFPEFYRLDARKDCDHLNDHGARRLTIQLTEDLIAKISKRDRR